MGLEIQGVTQKYGELTAIDDINLVVEEGEMVSLIGPSGCGKSTLLRTIAGLIPLFKGKLFFNNKDISHLPPQERNSVIVFQNYALFPHMTVEENIAYGLRVRKNKKEVVANKVEKILSKTELVGLNHRKINELSGGQQQRVALARALVVEPDILLFDEPLSNLDQNLRVAMRQNIRKIQQEYGITSIYVTHDQEEAMSISDRIIVMKESKIQQVGKPSEIYFTPKNRFVAEFMGIASIINFKVKGTRENHVEGRFLNRSVRLPLSFFPLNKKNTYELMFRPEDVEVKESGMFEGIILWQEILGPVKRITIDCNGNSIILENSKYYRKTLQHQVGDKIRFDFIFSEAHIID